MVKIKRVYDPVSPDDGRRILVDRLWPRGLTKEGADIDEWLKDIAPSSELRKWFAHDPSKWEEFVRKYEGELRQKPEPMEYLTEIATKEKITLLFSARDREHNNALVIKRTIDHRKR